MKQIILFLLLATSTTSLAGDAEEVYVLIGFKGAIENLIEKKKSMSYSYDLGTQDPINIENHFGDVKVKFWEQNKIKVYITITANAPTEKKVNTFLSIVDIDRSTENGEVKFVTNLHCLESSFADNINSSKNDEDKNFLQVDYQVYMPKGHNLTVNNSHGDVYIPEFHDVLHIKQDYGTLFADHLVNENSIIDINFGKAFIKSMVGGKLKSTQTSLIIDRVEDVAMTHQCGSVRVLEINNTSIKASYTKGYLGKVNESCKFTVNYSKEFRLGEILADVEELEINSSYTNLELPLCVQGKFDLISKSNKTDIIMTKSSRVKYINSSNNADYYSIGDQNKSHATKVLLSTNYGRVSVK
ncbi:MAG: hypothetical protein ACI9IP_002529 [Arcticibacterium sp.]|jgi:hypothetical protein